MLELDIPGRGRINVKNVVFDVNGTISVDGKIDKRIKERLKRISEKYSVYILTADTYGTVERELEGIGVAIHKISPQKEAEQKQKFVDELGWEETIAVGNGANDVLMLRQAILGICVIEKEGACSQAIANSDIVVQEMKSSFALLENPKRIVATLRN
jgi:soluble P-type ATPase